MKRNLYNYIGIDAESDLRPATNYERSFVSPFPRSHIATDCIVLVAAYRTRRHALRLDYRDSADNTGG